MASLMKGQAKKISTMKSWKEENKDLMKRHRQRACYEEGKENEGAQCLRCLVI